MDGVIARGKVVEGSRTLFSRAPPSVFPSNRACPGPTSARLKPSSGPLLNARSICYSLGGSGIVAAHAIEKLGITGQMKSRTVHSDGTPAAGYVARGEVEMAIQQLNVSVPVAGTDYVGNLPGDLHEYVVFAIAIMSVSKQQEGGQGVHRVRYRAGGRAAVAQGNDGACVMASP